jgi:hypothetical protein
MEKWAVMVGMRGVGYEFDTDVEDTFQYPVEEKRR